VRPPIRWQQKNRNNAINILLLNLDEERISILEFLASAGNLFDFLTQLENNVINLDDYHIPMNEARAAFHHLVYVEIIREDQEKDPILHDNQDIPEGEPVPALQGRLPTQPATL
jgi:hypothetical protein